MQSWRGDALEERYAIKFCFKLGKNTAETYGMLQTAFRPSCMNRASVLSSISDSRQAGNLWGMVRDVGGVRKSINQSWLAKRLGLGLLCWGFKGVQDEIPSEEASTLQIGSVHQSTTPSLSQTIWPRWASRQFFSLSKVQTLARVTFGYSLSSKAVVMRQLRRWKRLWRRSLTRSYKRTSMRPSRSCWNGTTSALKPEEISSKGTRVSCFLSIKVSIRKKFGNLSYSPRISGILLFYFSVSLDIKVEKNSNSCYWFCLGIIYFFLQSHIPYYFHIFL